MKTKFFLLITVLFFTFNFIYSQTNSIFSSAKFEKNNRDVLSLNMIKADKDYYSRAILEYELSKRIIAKFFKTKGDSLIFEESDKQNFRCAFKPPINLSDLKSGFQFRYYIFDNDNTSALNAFGIVNSELKKRSVYIVIDYLQYQDYQCVNLPKIRYAVGIRTEFRIEKLDINKKNKDDVNNINLSNIAASVQVGKLNANITMKTIGITGVNPRLNLPNNSTFDVQSYADYLKIIESVKNLPDISKDSVISYYPQLIPIMDTYRTSIGEINVASFEMQNEIEKKLKKLEKKKSSYIKFKNSTNPIEIEYLNIYNRKVEALVSESKSIEKTRLNLSIINEKLNNLDNYVDILDNTSELPGILKGTASTEYNECYELLYKTDSWPDAQKCFYDFNTNFPTYWDAHEITLLLKNSNKDNKIEILKQLKEKGAGTPTGAKNKIQNMIDSLKVKSE